MLQARVGTTANGRVRIEALRAAARKHTYAPRAHAYTYMLLLCMAVDPTANSH